MKNIRNFPLYLLVLGYLHLYVFFLRRFGILLRGLGFALNCLRHDFYFRVQNCKFWFNPRCAAAYCIMPAGFWNEPETHVFLENILTEIPGKVDFIDIGASVGEMVVHMASSERVRNVIAFEPQEECAEAIRKSVRLNGLSNISVQPYAVSSKSGFVAFSFFQRSPTAANVSLPSEPVDTLQIPCVTLDEAITVTENVGLIMLIDVEGHELQVLRGATGTIKSALPLIIFEYNETSKKYFSLNDIINTLPDVYQYYRLRGDGFLDNDFSNSWNCVAVPGGTVFDEICKGLLHRSLK